MMNRRSGWCLGVALLLAGGVVGSGLGTPACAFAKQAKNEKARALASKGAVHEDPETVQRAFEVFCEEWMQRLAKRERDNVIKIQWEEAGNSVRGSYVGYSTEHTCTQNEGTDNVPVGRIMYREFRYEKRGTTMSDAQQSSPQTVEIFEVTEIFRWAAGKWDF